MCISGDQETYKNSFLYYNEAVDGLTLYEYCYINLF